MRSTVTLNIGLENNAMFGGDTPEMVAHNMAHWLRAFAQNTGYREDTLVGVTFVNPLEDMSNATEATAVVQYSAEDVTVEGLTTALMVLCAMTTQEAIAALIDDDEGDAPSRGLLIGPNAAAYGGSFAPSLFEIGSANAGDWTFSDLP